MTVRYEMVFETSSVGFRGISEKFIVVRIINLFFRLSLHLKHIYIWGNKISQITCRFYVPVNILNYFLKELFNTISNKKEIIIMIIRTPEMF